MTIKIDYPNQGMYSEGQARIIHTNPDGKILHQSRATPEQVMQYEMICAVQSLTDEVTRLIEEIRSVQTYGVRIKT